MKDPVKRLLIVSAFLTYSVSLSVVLAASIVKQQQFPLWGKILDIVSLTLLICLAVVLQKIKPPQVSLESTKLGYVIAMHIPVTLVAIWLTFPQLLHWDILLAGLAWRSYYFMLIFPTVWDIWKKLK